MNGNTRKVMMLSAAVIAGVVAGSPANAQAPAGAAPAAPPPTPRLADGHPDLTGLWVGGGGGGLSGGGGVLGSGATEQVFAGRGNSFVGFEADGGLFRTSNVNKPEYKPEYWDQIIELEYNGNWEDPQQYCMPAGVPRMGAPSQIFSMPNMPYVILMYVSAFNRETYRLVPTDGRPHNKLRVAAEAWNGDPVGHWDGDTLVIETVGLSDASWLHKNGYIHGFNTTVTERITRPNANTLRWEATVEDPDYLTKPWTMDPVTRTLNKDASAVVIEPYPCLELDRDRITSHTCSG
jgi:hypothetical protein